MLNPQPIPLEGLGPPRTAGVCIQMHGICGDSQDRDGEEPLTRAKTLFDLVSSYQDNLRIRRNRHMNATRPVGTRTLEDVLVSFLTRHAGKIYLGLLVLALVVVNLHPGA